MTARMPDEVFEALCNAKPSEYGFKDYLSQVIAEACRAREREARLEMERDMWLERVRIKIAQLDETLDQRDEARAQCAALREALEPCRPRPHEHNPGPEFTVTRCEVIDRALASDAGRTYRAEIIERCAKLFEGPGSHVSSWHAPDIAARIRALGEGT